MMARDKRTLLYELEFEEMERSIPSLVSHSKGAIVSILHVSCPRSLFWSSFAMRLLV